MRADLNSALAQPPAEPLGAFRPDQSNRVKGLLRLLVPWEKRSAADSPENCFANNDLRDRGGIDNTQGALNQQVEGWYHRTTFCDSHVKRCRSLFRSQLLATLELNRINLGGQIRPPLSYH
jgi:hypothetical protein